MSSILPNQGDSLGADGHTKLTQSAGSKQIKAEHLRMGQPADVCEAPPSRIYTKDYTKVAPEKDDSDQVSPFLGNPLRW